MLSRFLGTLWGHVSKVTSCFLLFCLASVGSVHLLRCVEAPETVGDPGRGHLEKPADLQAGDETGSVAILLLHVCPRWVRVGGADDPVFSM